MKKVLIPIFILSITTSLCASQVQVIDGLMWQDDKDTKVLWKNWREANSYCKKLNIAGHTDWYLPKKEQLKSLFRNKSKLNNLASKHYWSSSVYSNSDAWYVNIIFGAATDHTIKSVKGHVRCVREQ